MVHTYKRLVHCIEPGEARSAARTRWVTYKLDDEDYKLFAKRSRLWMTDAWGNIITQKGRHSLLRLLLSDSSHALSATDGDRFNLQKHNWRLSPPERQSKRRFVELCEKARLASTELQNSIKYLPTDSH